MREREIGAVENIHGALPYIRFAPIPALVGVRINRLGKDSPCLCKARVSFSKALLSATAGVFSAVP